MRDFGIERYGSIEGRRCDGIWDCCGLDVGINSVRGGRVLRREESLSELEVATALRALRSAIAVGDEEAARQVVISWVRGYQPPAQVKAAQ